MAVDTTALLPDGSLLQRTTITDSISVVNQLDEFTLSLDAGQVASLAIRPAGSLQPMLELVDASNIIVGTASAVAAGEKLLIESMPLVAGGTYRVRVSGLSSSLGDYTAEVLVNAAFETESYLSGATNNTPGTAQDLNSGFFELAGGLAEEVAVVGQRGSDLRESFERPLSPQEWTTSSSAAGGLVFVSSEFGKADGNAALVLGRSSTGAATLNQATWNVDLSGASSAVLNFSHASFHDVVDSIGPASFTGNANGDGVLLSVDGTTWYRLMNLPDVTFGTWRSESIDLSAFATSHSLTLGHNVQLRFQQFGTGSLSIAGRAIDALRIDTTPAAPVEDWYRVSLHDGDAIAVSLASLHAQPEFHGTVELYDSTQQLLATSEPGDELTQSIRGFLTPATADYLLKVNDPPTDYSLVVTLDASFDREQNDGLLSAQVLDADLPLQSLGYVSDQVVGSLETKLDFPGPGYTGFIPPDPTMAAGPSQLVALVNTQIAIYDKGNGTSLFQQDISGPSGFFGIAGAQTTLFDPWVLYDTDSQRFFVVAVEIQDVSHSNLYLAVSTTSTPHNGADWHKYRFDFTHFGEAEGLGSGAHFPDYEKIGTNHDALFISANYEAIDDGLGEYAGITAFDKASLLAGLPAQKLYEEYFDGLTVFPLHQVSSSSTMYFAEELGVSSIRLHAVSDLLTNPQRATFDLAVPAYDAPALVPQPVSGLTGLQSIDARIMTGVWRDGSAWFAHAVIDPALGNQEDVARWYQVSTNNFPQAAPTLVQSGNVDPGPGLYGWMPAIAVDGEGNMGLGLSVGGTTMFGSAGYTGRSVNAPLGETLPVQIYAPGGGPYQLRDGSNRNRWGDYSGISVDPSDDRTFWVFNEFAAYTPTISRWATRAASFSISPLPEGDFYEFNANQNDSLIIETFTPFDGPGQVDNPLDPKIRVYGPDGTLLASDDNGAVDLKNARLLLAATQTGKYRVEVLSAQHAGSYFLSITGSTASGPSPEVIDATPDDGQLVAVFPTTFAVTFSEDLSIPSLQAADLIVDGVPAQSVSVSGRTATFTINPTTNHGPGTYGVTLSAGAVADLQGQVNTQPFSGAFTFDNLGPTITTTAWNGAAFPANATFAPGALEIAATLTEDMFLLSSARRGPLSPSADDVILLNLDTNAITNEDHVSYSTTTDQFVAQYADVPEGNYRLTLVSGNGAFEDGAGNDLDGEPNISLAHPDGAPTGNGTSGGNYQRDFVVDQSSAPLFDFERLAPLGGLIATSQNNRGFINATGDTDQFTFFGQQGQLVSAQLDVAPAKTLTLKLLNASNTILAMASSASPGAAVVLPVTLLAVDDVYHYEISGSAIADYTLDVFLNAAVESFANDTSVAQALAIDASRVDVGAGRWAVVGTTEQKLQFVKSNNPSQFVDIAATGTAVSQQHDDQLNLIDTTVGNSLIPAGQVIVSNNGGIMANFGNFLYFRNLPLPAPDLGRVLLPYWDDLGLTFDVPLGSPSVSTHNLYYREQQVSGIDTLIVQWQDMPHFDLAFGSITFQAQLFATGNTLARFAYKDTVFGNSDYDHAGSATIGYQASNSEGYQFNFGDLDLTGAIPENPVQDGDIVDLVRGNDVDVYSIDLSGRAGHRVDVVVSGLDGLDVSSGQLELLDPNGNVLATGSPTPLGPSSSNFDLGILSFTVPNIGSNVYQLRFSSNQVGDYGLVVTDQAEFDTEPNQPADVLRSIGDGQHAVGYVDDVDRSDRWQTSIMAGTNISVTAQALFDDVAAMPLNSLPVFGLDVRLLASDGVTVLASDTVTRLRPVVELTVASAATQTVFVEVSTPGGAAGEYQLDLFASRDFGDAPDSFGTLLSSNGPSHAPYGPTLGAARDVEVDGSPTASSDGDDVTSSDDEDGVTLFDVAAGQNGAAWVVDVQNVTSAAYLSAWVDFDASGTFTAGEQIGNGVAVVNGTNVLTFNVPVTAVVGARSARFRVSSAIVGSPLGFVADGEVEDYVVNVVSPAPFTVNADVNVASDVGTPTLGNVLLNDDALSGPPLTIANAQVFTGQLGNLNLFPNGGYSYLVTDKGIDSGFVGTDVFLVVVTNGVATLSSALQIHVTGVNDAPQFVPPFDFNVDELTSAVGIVTATDVDRTDAISYGIGSGDDSSLFVVDSQTGALSFQSPPNFEHPIDGDQNNIYVVNVTATDGTATTTHAYTVTVLDVAEPQVLSVWALGTSWQAPFLDAVDGVFGDGQTRGYQIPSGPNQNRPLPWNGINRLLVHFNQDVHNSLQVTDFGLVGVPGLLRNGSPATIPAISSIEFGADPTFVTLVLNRNFQNSILNVAVLSSGVANDNGVSMDADFNFRFAVLPGDMNQDGAVGLFDLTRLAATYGKQAGAPGNYSVLTDINGDGQIELFDLTGLAGNYGTSSPLPGPPLPAKRAALAAPANASAFDAALSELMRSGVLPLAITDDASQLVGGKRKSSGAFLS